MECVLHAKRTLGLAPSAPHTRPSAPHTRPSAGQCMVEVEQEGSRQASVPAPAARASKPRLSIQAPTQLVYLIKSGYYTGLHKHETQTHTLTLQCSTNRKVSQPNHKIYNPFQLICITNSQVNTLHRKKELDTFVWSICWF